jgi:hypothetical protein
VLRASRAEVSTANNTVEKLPLGVSASDAHLGRARECDRVAALCMFHSQESPREFYDAALVTVLRPQGRSIANLSIGVQETDVQ